MASTASRPLKKLIVEGTDDLFVIVNMARILRPGWDQKEARRWFGGFEVKDAKNDEQAIKEFALALKEPPDGKVGLVLDADDQNKKRLADRWSDVCKTLQPHLPGVPLPTAPDPGGWIGQLPGGPRVGVWIMPDNQQPSGALEAFLSPFVAPTDPCWQYADDALSEAKKRGAPFPEHHRNKARLHTWLAWRKEAGRPYGRAIESGDLDPRGNATAEALVDWLDRLFS